MTTYNAIDYRAKLKGAFSTWTGKSVVVRNARGAELARGKLLGFSPDVVNANAPRGGSENPNDQVYYVFGPELAEPLSWDRAHSIEVIPTTS